LFPHPATPRGSPRKHRPIRIRGSVIVGSAPYRMALFVALNSAAGGEGLACNVGLAHAFCCAREIMMMIRLMRARASAVCFLFLFSRKYDKGWGNVVGALWRGGSEVG
jgi:hypothetical protein